jgi:hypothetical protein
MVWFIVKHLTRTPAARARLCVGIAIQLAGAAVLVSTAVDALQTWIV